MAISRRDSSLPKTGYRPSGKVGCSHAVLDTIHYADVGAGRFGDGGNSVGGVSVGPQPLCSGHRCHSIQRNDRSRGSCRLVGAESNQGYRLLSGHVSTDSTEPTMLRFECTWSLGLWTMHTGSGAARLLAPLPDVSDRDSGDELAVEV